MSAPGWRNVWRGISLPALFHLKQHERSASRLQTDASALRLGILLSNSSDEQAVDRFDDPFVLLLRERAEVMHLEAVQALNG